MPSGPSPNANGKIRYTTNGAIRYFRGSSLRKPPRYQQYPQLAQSVVGSGHFMGRNFSVGDRFIYDCAAGTARTGNLGTWVRVDQNHHFEFTAVQLESLSAQVRDVGSQQAAERLVAD